MDYVRVDFDDCYIYLQNNILGYAWDGDVCTPQYRATELVRQRPMWAYKRIKRMSKLPIDKKVNVWYNKAKR
jgi:hypothetical protein